VGQEEAPGMTRLGSALGHVDGAGAEVHRLDVGMGSAQALKDLRGVHQIRGYSEFFQT
jgi:hypothetical protein